MAHSGKAAVTLGRNSPGVSDGGFSSPRRDRISSASAYQRRTVSAGGCHLAIREDILRSLCQPLDVTTGGSGGAEAVVSGTRRRDHRRHVNISRKASMADVRTKPSTRDHREAEPVIPG